MGKAITPGQLLARVLAEENISVRQMAKRLHVPPTRAAGMIESKRGFEDATLEKLARAIPGYSVEWWKRMIGAAKAGRLVSDDNG